MPKFEDSQPVRRTVPHRKDASRLDEVFGQIIPETTSDEREPSSAEMSGESDEWYLENRPPHH